MMSSNEREKRYTVEVTTYAKKHYIKDFKKKYHARRWNLTLEGITTILSKPLTAIEQNDIETIVSSEQVLICKLQFKIFGSNKSAKREGTRCIVALEKETQTTRILLVYHKNHVRGSQETRWWGEHIKNTYPEYQNLSS